MYIKEQEILTHLKSRMLTIKIAVIFLHKNPFFSVRLNRFLYVLVFKGEGHSKKRIFFVIITKKFILSQVTHRSFSFKNAFHSKKFVSKEAGIGSRHFETNAQRPGQARPLSVTSCCSRDFVLASVFVYSRSWLIINFTVLN